MPEIFLLDRVALVFDHPTEGLHAGDEGIVTSILKDDGVTALYAVQFGEDDAKLLQLNNIEIKSVTDAAKELWNSVISSEKESNG